MKNTCLVVLLFLSISFCKAQLYKLEKGGEYTGSGKAWTLLEKTDSFYSLKQYNTFFRQYGFNNKLIKESEVTAFNLVTQKGYEFSEITVADSKPVRLDFLYEYKKKQYIVNGVVMDGTAPPVPLLTIPSPLGDRTAFIEQNMVNDDGSFSIYTCHPNRDSVVFHFKTYESNFSTLNEWYYTLPYRASTFTLWGKTGVNMIHSVYNIDNTKLCLIIDEVLKQPEKDLTHQLVAYIYDFSSEHTRKVILKKISRESSVKMTVNGDLLFLYSEIHKDKYFAGISFLTYNVETYQKELEEETFFNDEEKKELMPRADQRGMTPVSMHIGSSENAYIIYEVQSSFIANFNTYRPSPDRNMEFVFGDIVVLSLSSDGELYNIHRIPKSQRSNDNYRFGSFHSLVYRDKLYLFLNDIADKYEDFKIVPMKSSIVFPETASLMGICITEDGKMSWQEICKTVSPDGFMICSQDMISLDENKILIPTDKGNNNTTSKKQRHLFLTIE